MQSKWVDTGRRPERIEVVPFSAGLAVSVIVRGPNRVPWVCMERVPRKGIFSGFSAWVLSRDTLYGLGTLGKV